MRRYSPLPRINPSSPTQSREASPSFDNGQDRPPYSDSQDSLDANHYRHPKQRYEDGTDEEGSPPYPARTAYKESPQASPEREYPKAQREPERAYARNQRSPPPDSYRKEENSYRKDEHSTRKDENSYRKGDDSYRKGENSDPYARDRNSDPETVPPLDRSPQHSREVSPTRRGGPQRGPANGYEQRDAAYTTNTNEDSGVAGMTPEDQYKNRDKENFYDSLNR